MLLESVPNISEGRRPEVLERLADAAASVAGAHLLDRSADPDHNRSVFTLAGEAKPLEEALLRLFAEALASIDLRRHRGVHPRVGAVDVVPFVPLAGASMDDAATVARSLARSVSERHGIAVYLYGATAAAEGRRDLAAIRKCGPEGLARRLADPAWRPDFGPPRIDPRWGVSVIGARFFLIAFNVVLANDDLAAARQVARAVRQSSGGLPAVKAIGVPLASCARAQVSMNLTDYRLTSLDRAFDAVREEARRHGAEVERSEIVGLVPEAAMRRLTPERLMLQGYSEAKLLETHLRRLGLGA
jgi:glutamate formiminotransferase